MKIAVMVRGFIPAPRPADIVYIIIDLAVAIAEGLAKRGHQVDFYGPHGSKLNIPVRTRHLRPLVTTEAELGELRDSTDLLTHYVPSLWDQHLVLDMFHRAERGKYDLLHFHHPETSLPMTQMFPTVPVAYTLHDALDGWHKEIFKMFPAKTQSFISISDSQRRPVPWLPYAGTVYNGIETNDFPFSDTAEDYMLFVGRLTPEKGVREAVQVARRTGEKLFIIGPVYRNHEAYFNKYVRRYLNDKIRYLGFINRGDILSRYFQKAKCLITPIRWEEPFGVTMIEAMASGTPVIAFRRGSVCEVVKDGKTGFIVDNVREMAAAIKKLPTIARRDCHVHATTNFSIEKMIDGYEAVFKTIIAAHKNRTSEALQTTLPSLESYSGLPLGTTGSPLAG